MSPPPILIRKTSFPDSILTRDKRIAEKQEKVSVCLAAIGSTPICLYTEKKYLFE